MKQHILPKQANELTKEEFYSIFKDKELVDRDDWANYHHKKITIGKMLEFLGEDKTICDELWAKVKKRVKK